MPKYRNLDGTTPDKSLADLLRWNANRPRRSAEDVAYTPPRRENDGSGLFAGDALTWIGHATFLFALGGVRVATDPIWAERLGLNRRISPPGVPLGAVPPLDVVTVSHDHYDHMDLGTLRALARRGADGRTPTFVVPRDNGAVLHDAGLTNVVELGWWESTRVGRLRITLVPAQHWAMRVPWDRNERLWGGFVYELLDAADDRAPVVRTLYHTGDTAFSEDVFAAIARAFPRIDVAMMPIGAYEPTWFMAPQHIGPEDAVRAFQRLGAGTFCAMHWGTYRLTDEPLAEPPRRVAEAFAAAGLDPARLWILAVGEQRPLTDAAAPSPPTPGAP